MDNHLIVLYDGVCGLCNKSIQFILKRDKKDAFRFASLQSEFGRKILHRHGKDPDRLDTFIVVQSFEKESERLIIKARAALFVAKNSGWLLEGLLWLRDPAKFSAQFFLRFSCTCSLQGFW